MIHPLPAQSLSHHGLLEALLTTPDYRERVRLLSTSRCAFNLRLVRDLLAQARAVAKKDAREACRRARLGILVANEIKDQEGRLACLLVLSRAAVHAGADGVALHALDAAEGGLETNGRTRTEPGPSVPRSVAARLATSVVSPSTERPAPPEDVKIICCIGPYEVDALVRNDGSRTRVGVVGQVIRSDGIFDPVSGVRVSLVGGRPASVRATTTTDEFGKFRLATDWHQPCELRLGDGRDVHTVHVWDGGKRGAAATWDPLHGKDPA
ncbi:MAG: carboxypeptidase-like regulatory domain-containing protein [Planctomycetota bacterium]